MGKERNRQTRVSAKILSLLFRRALADGYSLDEFKYIQAKSSTSPPAAILKPNRQTRRRNRKWQ